MSLSFNDLCIADNNAAFNTYKFPSPMELDMYKEFPSFDKVDFLLEKDCHESTELNTSHLPTPHLSPALTHSTREEPSKQP